MNKKKYKKPKLEKHGRVARAVQTTANVNPTADGGGGGSPYVS